MPRSGRVPSNRFIKIGLFFFLMEEAADFSQVEFGPALLYPAGCKLEVVDLSGPDASAVFSSSPFTVGRYLERRGIYSSDLFIAGEGRRRCVHLGVDLGAPVGTVVLAPCEGVVLHCGFNPAAGDYGHCVVTRHQVGGRSVYFLFGHLGRSALEESPSGRVFGKGARLGVLGSPEENGGWPPHLHFQLALHEPATHDLPGVCCEDEVEESARLYPDPRLVLGPLW